VGESPSDVAARSDVTITCVTATDDERAALMGAEGEPSPVIDGVRAGSMVLGMSPVSPAATREFEVQLAECGVRLRDSPISGGEQGTIGADALDNGRGRDGGAGARAADSGGDGSADHALRSL
jgi:2-hydroxy-3-oxopropionate reductase